VTVFVSVGAGAEGGLLHAARNTATTNSSNIEHLLVTQEL
jgi:hypothetical protein